MTKIAPIRSTDDQIFSLFNSASEQGLTLLYNRLSNAIRLYGFRLVRDEFIVNTVVQEAFLKTWAFRERMTSLEHVRRFLKLTVRWECMAYYRDSKSKFYRSLTRFDWFENTKLIESLTEQDDTDYKSKYLNELLRLIPSLPNQGQRRALELHIREGLSAKEISQRLQLPTRVINEEINSACKYLRSLLEPKILSSAVRPRSVESPLLHEKLTTEQRHIYSMRYDLRYSFLQISELLKLPQPYVQQQYVQAHATLKTI
ncbi:MAG TPA: sigma-70 family RNA polymerase sigma factor [Chryseolinea sp.]